MDIVDTTTTQQTQLTDYEYIYCIKVSNRAIPMRFQNR
jgi:hypothetical protein